MYAADWPQTDCIDCYYCIESETLFQYCYSELRQKFEKVGALVEDPRPAASTFGNANASYNLDSLR